MIKIKGENKNRTIRYEQINNNLLNAELYGKPKPIDFSKRDKENFEQNKKFKITKEK